MSLRVVERRPCHPCRPTRRVCLTGRHRNVCRPWRRKFRTCPGRCPGCRCKSSYQRSFVRTSLNRGVPVRGSVPSWPTRRRGWSWRSKRAARIRECETLRPACRIGPAAFRHSPALSVPGRSRRSWSSCAQLCRRRRKQSIRPDARRRRDRGCSSGNEERLPDAIPCSSTQRHAARELSVFLLTRILLLSAPQPFEPTASVFLRQLLEFAGVEPHAATFVARVDRDFLNLRFF